MLANETEMFRFLNHMGIIKVKEIFENRSHIYIIAELVKNGDLFDYVLNEEFLEEYEASLIMKQLFETVKYIHDCGVIHRDLKPENIMIIKG
jgi:serine/threonine protein kinase